MSDILEQIKNITTKERDSFLICLAIYDSWSREGWEDGMSFDEARKFLFDWLGRWHHYRLKEYLEAKIEKKENKE